MIKHFIKSLLQHFLLNCLGLLFPVFWLISINDTTWIPAIAIVIAFLIASYQVSDDLCRELKNDLNKALKETEQTKAEASRRIELAEKDSSLWKKTLLEKTSGFPSLIKLIEEYDQTKDVKVETYLKTKSHPAFTSAEVVKEEARRRRFAESELKKIKAIIEYYETIAPFLLDFKDEVTGIENEDSYRDYTEEECLDPAVAYLAKEEFRKLPSVERNQMALDRFWSRPKSKWLIGRIYERYVGYLYETQGYDVEYTGIFKGLEDLGRDLICSNQKEAIIIQCKCWSQFRTIYEKHIFQFFGTVFEYRDANPEKKVRAMFYTSTKLSNLAQRFAKGLSIELKEDFPLNPEYPCIKCNIANTTKEKIYHLPFDQQYDKVKIELHKGEFFCRTVKEAEDKGFRRAFRYKGIANE